MITLSVGVKMSHYVGHTLPPTFFVLVEFALKRIENAGNTHCIFNADSK